MTIHFQPTINPDEDYVLKVGRRLTCKNNFSTDIFLDKEQFFIRFDVFVFQDLISDMLEDEKKKWAVISRISSLNEAISAYDPVATYSQPLDTFTKDKNYATVLDKRIIEYKRSRFNVSLGRLSPEGEPEQTKLEDLQQAFGDYSPVIIKAAIW